MNDPFIQPQLSLFGAKPAAPAVVAPATTHTKPSVPVESNSLQDARKTLMANLDKGSHCPCCDQFAKVYRRSLNAGMAAALLVILRRTSEIDPVEGWLHVPDDFEKLGGVVSVLRNREYPRLRFWGLLESYEGPSGGDVPYSGKWRITPAGREFCLGRLSVPRVLFFYNGQVLADRNEEDVIDIKAALGEKFSFDGIMGGHK